MSADLTERLIADILEVTESLMGTLSIQMSSEPSPLKSATSFHSVLSEHPPQYSNNTHDNGASTQLTHNSAHSILSSLFIYLFNTFANFIPSFIWQFTPFHSLHFNAIHPINLISTRTAGGLASMMAAATSSIGVHQPDSHHGRPEHENFDVTGEPQGQSTYAKQC